MSTIDGDDYMWNTSDQTTWTYNTNTTDTNTIGGPWTFPSSSPKSHSFYWLLSVVYIDGSGGFQKKELNVSIITSDITLKVPKDSENTILVHRDAVVRYEEDTLAIKFEGHTMSINRSRVELADTPEEIIEKVIKILSSKLPFGTKIKVELDGYTMEIGWENEGP